MSKAGRVYCSAVEQELPESGHAGLGEESGGIFGSRSCPTPTPGTNQPIPATNSLSSLSDRPIAPFSLNAPSPAKQTRQQGHARLKIEQPRLNSASTTTLFLLGRCISLIAPPP